MHALLGYNRAITNNRSYKALISIILWMCVSECECILRVYYVSHIVHRDIPFVPAVYTFSIETCLLQLQGTLTTTTHSTTLYSLHILERIAFRYAVFVVRDAPVDVPNACVRVDHYYFT